MFHNQIGKQEKTTDHDDHGTIPKKLRSQKTKNREQSQRQKGHIETNDHPRMGKPQPEKNSQHCRVSRRKHSSISLIQETAAVSCRFRHGQKRDGVGVEPQRSEDLQQKAHYQDRQQGQRCLQFRNIHYRCSIPGTISA